jgi:hypothetical protein
MRDVKTVLCTAALLACFGSEGFAQTVTTGTLSGTVVDQQDAILPGAPVTAVHQPTGTSYESVTGGDGRFQMLSVRVGGPYQVTARMAGFREQQLNDIYVGLGEDRAVAFKLPLATVTETVTVTAEAPLIDASRAGTASNVGSEALETLPTISRSLFDFARVSPYFSPIALNTDPNSISVAGQNNRYNNVQIDGAVNNDLFGLAASGTPGGQTEAEPVSLDAIQELQLLVSPYDVRQGMFAGGGINAVTKTGTNQIHGAGYYYGRNQQLVGKSPEGRAIADFGSKQFGASAGGPIAANRAFYFANIDFGRKTTPSGFSVSGGGQQFGLTDEVARFLSILGSRYNYNPGGTDEFIRTTDNNKVFVRADFNLRPGQRLTTRHNYVDAVNDIGRPDATRFIFPDTFYQFRSKTNSTVVQHQSTVLNGLNEFRFTYQRIRDRRSGQTSEERPFPQIDVRVGGGSRFLRAGREEFSTANELDQDILEITNDFTKPYGSHTLTVGTHNEFFRFRNLFIRDAFGAYVFSSLDLFEQGLAQAYDYSFAVSGDPRLAARFTVHQFGVYAGDQWRAAPRLTMTYGVRLDMPRFPDKPTRNPDAEALYGFSTEVVPNQTLWSPRVGLTYDLGGEGRDLIRGGLGMFAGRTPYVWLSNQYGNTGIEFRRIRATENANSRIPFVADVSAQPTTITGATGSVSRNEIDVIDPAYKYPQLLRGNLAYDRELFRGLVGTAELLFSATVRDIKYQNINLVQTSTRLDGRPAYTTKSTQYGDVILLTNADQGSQWSVSYKIEKPWRSGWYASGSYLYGRSRSITDGTRSQAVSNWNSTFAPDTNNPPLARSNFDPGHRVNLAFSREFPVGGAMRATASVYYSGQSGRPYTMNYSSDFNGDGQSLNDPLYIPGNAAEVVFRNGTFDQFMAFINGEECFSDYVGRIHERNACRGPWISTLDVRLAVGLLTRGARKVEFTFDFLNLANRFDSDSGLVRYANFNDILAARYVGVDTATGKPAYDIGTLVAVDAAGNPTFQKFLRDDLKSRWQAQWGLRVRF